MKSFKPAHSFANICILLASMTLATVTFAAKAKSGRFPGENYQTMLTCDNGVARIIVDGSERRNVRLIIRDENIINYMGVEHFDSVYFGETSYASVTGWTTHGPFQPSEFHWFKSNNNGLEDIYREGNGLKAVFKAPNGEEKNWYFADCRTL